MKVGQINARLKKQSMLMNKIQNELEGKKANVLEIDSEGIYDTYGYSYAQLSSVSVTGVEKEYIAKEDIQIGDAVKEDYKYIIGNFSIDHADEYSIVAISDTRFAIFYSSTYYTQLRVLVLEIIGDTLNVIKDASITSVSNNPEEIKAILLSNGLFFIAVRIYGATCYSYLVSLDDSGTPTLKRSLSTGMSAGTSGCVDCVELSSNRILVASTSAASATTIRWVIMSYTTSSISIALTYQTISTTSVTVLQCTRASDSSGNIIYIDDGNINLYYVTTSGSTYAHTLKSGSFTKLKAWNNGSYASFIVAAVNTNNWYGKASVISSTLAQNLWTYDPRIDSRTVWGYSEDDKNIYYGLNTWLMMHSIKSESTTKKQMRSKEKININIGENLNAGNSVGVNGTVVLYVRPDSTVRAATVKYCILYRKPQLVKALPGDDIIGIAIETKNAGETIKIITKEV